MSKKGYYIADPDNYIQKQILKHIEKTEEDIFIRVSYPKSNPKKEKSGKITKILNKSKPKLFKNYIQKSSKIFIDLLLNPDKEEDVEIICDAIKNSKYLDEPVQIVAISSMMSWIKTNPYLYYKKNHENAYRYYLKEFNMPDMFVDEKFLEEQKRIEEERLKKKEEEEEFLEEETENKKNEKNFQSQKTETIQEIDEQEEKQDINSKTEQNDTEEPEKNLIDLKKITPKHINTRSPHKNYKKIKNLEQKLLNLTKINQNIQVYILYTGLLYGSEQLSLKPFFEKSFKQSSLQINSQKTIQNYNIPLFNINLIGSTIMKILENEQLLENDNIEKSVYEGEIIDLKNSEDNSEGENEENEGFEGGGEIVKEEREEEGEVFLGKKVVLFLDEKKRLNHRRILEVVSENFGNYKVCLSKKEFDEILIQDYNFEKNLVLDEILGEDFKGFEDTIKDQIIDFLSINKLGPIKIFLNYFNEKNKKLAKIISFFYKIKIINVGNFLNNLIDLKGFESYKILFRPEEKNMLQLIMDKKIDFFFLNPSKYKKEIIFYLNLLKLRLSLNDCVYKGFVLVNQNYFADFISYTDFFYENKLSVRLFKKNLKKNYKIYLKEEKKKKKLQQKLREKTKRKLKRELKKKLEKEKQEQELENENKTKEENQNDSEKKEYNSSEEEESSKNDENKNEISGDTEQNSEKEENSEDEENSQKSEISEKEEDPEEEEIENEENIKKREIFFPDHFLILIENEEYDSLIDDLINFCIKKKIRYFLKNIFFNSDIRLNKLFQDLLAFFRIYIERVF